MLIAETAREKMPNNYRVADNELDKILIKSISKATGIPEPEIEKTSLEAIEKKFNIKPERPRVYFDWEKFEKTGWQREYLRFVDDKTIKKRKEAVDKYIRKQADLK